MIDVVAKRLNSSALGQDFFLHRIVLVALVNGKVLFCGLYQCNLQSGSE